MERFRYDNTLHQVIEDVKEPDQNHLEFIKSLVDTGKLQGDTMAEVIVFQKPTMQEHVAENGAM